MNIQKEQETIERLRAFEPKDEPYFLCYSGGKDSDVIRILAALAGVKHEVHHNLTTVDAPETVWYVQSQKDIIIDKSYWPDGRPKTMWNLITKKLVPPTRLMRYFCAHLKEHGGEGRLKITGVRWAESVRRAESADVVRVHGKPKDTEKRLREMGLDFRITSQGGIVLNAQSGDNETARDKTDFVHHCYIDRSVTINPIIDWTDKDIWDFLHHYGCSGNPLYQCGKRRVGCIGCPLATAKNQKKDFRDYPKYKENYIKAFDRMVRIRKERGMYNNGAWSSGEAVLKWWIGEDANQLSFFDDDELYTIMSELSE